MGSRNVLRLGPRPKGNNRLRRPLTVNFRGLAKVVKTNYPVESRILRVRFKQSQHNRQSPGDRQVSRNTRPLSVGCEGVFCSGGIGDQIALMTLVANARYLQAPMLVPQEFWTFEGRVVIRRTRTTALGLPSSVGCDRCEPVACE